MTFHAFLPVTVIANVCWDVTPYTLADIYRHWRQPFQVHLWQRKINKQIIVPKNSNLISLIILLLSLEVS